MVAWREKMAEIREQAVSLLNEAKMAVEISSKADTLKAFLELVLHRDPTSLLPEFMPYLMELQTESGSSIRKFLAECVSFSLSNFLPLFRSCVLYVQDKNRLLPF